MIGIFKKIANVFAPEDGVVKHVGEYDNSNYKVRFMRTARHFDVSFDAAKEFSISEKIFVLYYCKEDTDKYKFTKDKMMLIDRRIKIEKIRSNYT